LLIPAIALAVQLCGHFDRFWHKYGHMAFIQLGQISLVQANGKSLLAL
jgi:hypothetical protein